MKIVKRFLKIMLVLFILLSFAVFIDTLQAIIFINDPIISVTKKEGIHNSISKSGFWVHTTTYCDGSKAICYSPFRHAHLQVYNMRGCEGDDAEDLLKNTISYIAQDANYKESDSYELIINELTEPVFTIEKLYYDKAFSEKEAYISALLIEDKASCNFKKEFGKIWQTTEEFYSLWKESKCRKNYSNSKHYKS